MRCMQADERAMAAIYDRYHQGLMSFCRHMLGSRDAAEEAVGETFRLGQRALADSEEPVALRPWLYAIARNRCIAILRAGAAPRHDDSLHDLGRLPVDERAALLLAEDGDLPPDEIAQVLGVPGEQAEALVVRARDSLIAPRRPLTDACSAVRVELARPGTGQMSRGQLRRHLRDCPRCRGYRESVRRQHTALAAPVAASAGLREAAVGTAPRERRRPPVATKLAIGALVVVIAVLGIIAGVNALSQGPSTPVTKPATADAAQTPARKPTPAATPADPRPAQHRRHHRRHHHHTKPADTAAAAPVPAPQPAPAPPPRAVKPKPAKEKAHKHGGPTGPTQNQPVRIPKAPKTPKAPKAPQGQTPATPQAPPSAAGGTAAPPPESDHHGGGRNAND